MHCHLRQCLEDYGPLHTFWCFERYNGVLDSMPNNNKAIEVQLMKKFLRDVQTSATQLPEELTEQFSELLSATITSVRAEQLVQPISVTAQEGNTNFWEKGSTKHNIRVPSFSRKRTLSDGEGRRLLKLYCELYKVYESQVAEMSTIYLQYTHIYMFNKLLGSCKSRTASSSIVYITWVYEQLGLSDTLPARVAQINYFCEHSAIISGIHRRHVLANNIGTQFTP